MGWQIQLLDPKVAIKPKVGKTGYVLSLPYQVFQSVTWMAIPRAVHKKTTHHRKADRETVRVSHAE
jgi:hypothetical protein